MKNGWNRNNRIWNYCRFCRVWMSYKHSKIAKIECRTIQVIHSCERTQLLLSTIGRIFGFLYRSCSRLHAFFSPSFLDSSNSNKRKPLRQTLQQYTMPEHTNSYPRLYSFFFFILFSGAYKSFLFTNSIYLYLRWALFVVSFACVFCCCFFLGIFWLLDDVFLALWNENPLTWIEVNSSSGYSLKSDNKKQLQTKVLSLKCLIF